MHIYHSLGVVKTGEICLFVFVSSKHRKDVQLAIEFIVEEIKKKDDTDLADDELDIDVDAVDGDVSPDNDVDLGGDEDLGVAGTEGEPDEM